jgi:hypothetical protein
VWSSNKRRWQRQCCPLLNSICIRPLRPMGEWSYSSITLDLGNRWRWIWSFPPGKEPVVVPEPVWSEMLWRGESLLPLPETNTISSLHRLSYPGFLASEQKCIQLKDNLKWRTSIRSGPHGCLAAVCKLRHTLLNYVASFKFVYQHNAEIVPLCLKHSC